MRHVGLDAHVWPGGHLSRVELEPGEQQHPHAEPVQRAQDPPQRAFLVHVGGSAGDDHQRAVVTIRPRRHPRRGTGLLGDRPGVHHAGRRVRPGVERGREHDQRPVGPAGQRHAERLGPGRKRRQPGRGAQLVHPPVLPAPAPRRVGFAGDAGVEAVRHVHQHHQRNPVRLDLAQGRPQQAVHDHDVGTVRRDLPGHGVSEPRAEERGRQERRLVVHGPAMTGVELGGRRMGDVLAPSGRDPAGEAGRGQHANSVTAGR